MDQNNWKKIEAVLDKALTLPANKRVSFIEEQCKGAPSMKSEVFLLLDSIVDSEGWLENSQEYKEAFLEDLSQDLEQFSTDSTLIGRKVGAYTILDELGEGGMGSVYLAKRSDGSFEHQVAIKLIRRGRATAENVRRFKQERNILAGLNHSGIAKLFDGGITEDGIPYLIMEYVDGVPIDKYCFEQQLSLADRISLFEQVLEAIRHAHENLVIHRDLKPGNILVTPDGNVKILDFGISKLVEKTDTQADLTHTKARVLTPRYAAPEQLTQETITTATDIYALGTIFYQLLSGVHPLALKDLSFYEIEQEIIHSDPPCPSSKITSPFPVSKKQLKGDLDAIILKALRKNPHLRYRGISEFLDDIHNYKQNLPVSAQQNSLEYRTGKFFRRHRQGLSITAGIILLVSGLLIIHTWRITEERDQAQLHAEKAQEVTQFVIDLLSENYPENSQGDTVTVREVLDQSVIQIKELKKSDDIKGKLLQVIGHSYQSMGELKKAKNILRYSINLLESRQTPDLDLARSYDVYGITARDLGNYREAETSLEKSVSLYRKLGVLKDPLYAKALKNLAYVKRLQSKYEEASVLITDALDVEKQISDDPTVDIAESLYILASVNRKQGKYQEAIENQQKSLAILEKLIDGPHPGIMANYSNLGILYKVKNDLESAKQYYLKAHRMGKKLYGVDHPEIAVSSANLSRIYLTKGNFDSAKVLINRSLEITRKTSGENSPLLANYLDEYAKLYSYRKQYQKADSIYRAAIEILKTSYKDDNPRIAEYLHDRAHNARLQKKFTTAVNLFRKALRIKQQHFADDHPSFQNTLQDLIRVLRLLNRTEEASSLDKLRTES